MKTFVMGDIHGAHAALLQCLERAHFDRAVDRLIVLGDVCDVCPAVRECIDELRAIPGCEYVVGNHDVWALAWAMRGMTAPEWLEQGGEQTILSYGDAGMPQEHIDFLNKSAQWIEHDNRLFVHAGFDPRVSMTMQSLKTLAYDRSFLVHTLSSCAKKNAGAYDDVFVGHTPTMHFGQPMPLHVGNVWALDTGAGWGGRLTIMDVASKEFWQSDATETLYPGCSRSSAKEKG